MFFNKKRKYSFLISDILNTFTKFTGSLDSKELSDRNIIIGKNVDIGSYVTIGYGTKIGNNVTINDSTTIMGGVIGDGCIIGSVVNIDKNVQILNDTIIENNCDIKDGVIIEDCCIIRNGSILNNKCYIEYNTIIGKNSVLNAGARINKCSVIGSNVRIHDNILIEANSIIHAYAEVLNSSYTDRNISQKHNKYVFDHVVNYALYALNLSFDFKPERVEILEDGSISVFSVCDNEHIVFNFIDDDFKLSIDEYKAKFDSVHESREDEYELFLKLKDKFGE